MLQMDGGRRGSSHAGHSAASMLGGPVPLHASPLKRNRKSSQSQVEVEVVDEETLLDSALEVVFG